LQFWRSEIQNGLPEAKIKVFSRVVFLLEAPGESLSLASPVLDSLPVVPPGKPQSSLCQSLSHVRLFVTPWTVARQASLSMGFPRQDTGAGCHLLLQGIFLIQGSNLCFLHRQVYSLPLICYCDIINAVNTCEPKRCCKPFFMA